MARDRFVTEAGVAVPAVTASQMEAIDREATEGPGPTLLQMMENAGRSLADIATSMAPPGSGPIVVLAGRGGNGGGGVCAARHLVNRGFEVTVVRPGRGTPSPAVERQLGIYRETGGAIVADPVGWEPRLVVDALVGYGLAGPPEGATRERIEWANSTSAPVLCLDVPSGLDATTGDTPGSVVAATTTVTLALPKTGLDSPLCGELWLADIGIPRGVLRRQGVDLDPALFSGAQIVRLTA